MTTDVISVFLANKFSIFEEDLNSEHDSIRYSAIKSFNNLTIEESDFSKIKNLLENFEFRKEEMELLLSIESSANKLSSLNKSLLLLAQIENNQPNNIQKNARHDPSWFQSVSAWKLYEFVIYYKSLPRDLV